MMKIIPYVTILRIRNMSIRVDFIVRTLNIILNTPPNDSYLEKSELL